MWPYVFLIIAFVAATVFEQNSSTMRQDDLHIRMMVEKILEKEQINKGILKK